MAFSLVGVFLFDYVYIYKITVRFIIALCTLVALQCCQ